MQKSDFNFLLYQQLLNENPSVRARARRKQVIHLKELKAVEGRVFSSSTIDELTKVELTRWRQDFIYRGGQLGSGVEAPVSRQGLVPALQELATEPNITWLPAIMRYKEWFQGAILLDEWLRRPARIRPATLEETPNDFGPAVLNVVTMDWILTYGTPKGVYDQIINGKLWSNVAAKGKIGEMLLRTGITARAKSATGQKIGFGDLTSANVVAIERVYIQSRPVNIFSFYDGLTAAIANFNFHVAIKGTVSYTQNSLEVTVEEVGIYARDSYDFINDGGTYWQCLYCDDQPLGNWDTIAPDNLKGVGKISNNTFNNWRIANKKGGDFLVYSDIKVTRLNPPEIFVVPS